jgi:tetratricopeptide (TPR) repeat protein
LPVVLLLLDLWPLARAGRATWKSLVLEKAPLLALAAASCVITYLVQRAGGAMITAQSIPFTERLANAPVAIVIYLRQLIWPLDLAPYYPFEVDGGLALPLACAAGIAAVSVFAWKQRARRAWLAVGWFWFLGMLLPVIGLVQVGGQAHADRYTYLPAVGILLALTWTAREAIQHRPALRAPLCAALGIAAIACSVLSRAQTARWSDSAAMAQHMLDATGERNTFAHQILAQAVMKTDPARAKQHLVLALTLVPNLPGAHGSLGILFANEGRFADAAAEFEREIAVRPRPNAYKNLGYVLLAGGRTREALAAYDQALALEPDDAPTLLVVARTRATSPDPGVADAALARRLAERARALTGPDDSDATGTLAAAFAASGDFDQAVTLARRAHDAARRAGQAALTERARLQIEAYAARRVLR